MALNSEKAATMRIEDLTALEVIEVPWSPGLTFFFKPIAGP
jgi:hypothetical protein